MKNDGVWWNAVGSVCYAVANVYFSILITRWLGVEESGRFSLAFAQAQSLYIIGVFGIDAIHMTNIEGFYSFKSFLKTRLITIAMMFLGCFAYCFICAYTKNQSILLTILTVYFGIYACADVFQTQLFVKNRLDLAGKSLLYSSIGAYFTFGVALLLTHNSVYAFLCSVVFLLFLFPIVTIKPLKRIVSKDDYKDDGQDGRRIVFNLLVDGVPLCLSNFLFTLLSTMAKYAINAQLDDCWQGIYNILCQPIMLINLSAKIIYKPILGRTMLFIKEQNIKGVRKHIITIGSIVCLLGVISILFMKLIGIRIMTFVFSVNLQPYSIEIILMIVAAVPMAITSFLYLLVVAIGRTKILLWSTFCVTVASYFANMYLIKCMQLKGAFIVLIIGYSIINGILLNAFVKHIKKS